MENTNNEKAERSSTIIEFYNRCCQSAEVQRPWDSLHPVVQANFCEAVRIIHMIVYQGG